MFVHACVCGRKDEIRLGSGRFEVGYTYFGGSMHFDPVHTVRVAGLRITPSDPDDLEVVIGDRHWHFGIHHVSHQRFVVFARAFAAGKRLGDLNFQPWGVSVERVERGTGKLEPEPNLVVAAGDFLHLAGPQPALIRAWHYLNDGRPRQA